MITPRRDGRARWPVGHLRPRHDSEWLALYLAGRLTATAIAAGLLAWGGVGGLEVLLLLYGPLSTAVLAWRPAVRRHPAIWAIDFTLTLALVLASGDWRSPYYLMWLGSLALPATHLPLRRAVALAIVSSALFLVVAVLGGPLPGRLQLVSTETLAIHLSLPLLLVVSLAYAADAMRRLAAERRKRERLAIEAERRRIAWELHDSAKQRLHAAHLLVTSINGRVPADIRPIVDRAVVELESASSDMDTSLAELRSPLEGRRLDQALRDRVVELAPIGDPYVSVRGHAPDLPPLVGAHLYRIACEAVTNALRHADADAIVVQIATADHELQLSVRDNGVGLPRAPRAAANGLIAMENRAATIGAELALREPQAGRGTVVSVRLSLTEEKGDRP